MQGLLIATKIMYHRNFKLHLYGDDHSLYVEQINKNILYWTFYSVAFSLSNYTSQEVRMLEWKLSSKKNFLSIPPRLNKRQQEQSHEDMILWKTDMMYENIIFEKKKKW